MASTAPDRPATPHYPGRAPIEAYGNGGFRFAGMSHRGSILCLPDAMMAWTATDLDEVSTLSLAPLIESRTPVSFLLLGTGPTHRQPPPWMREMLAAAGIGLDAMATGPAARTWNILIAEGRPVAAALIATQ